MVFAITFATGIHCAAVAETVETSPPPQLNLFQRKGLDVRNNLIDRPINLFGYVCHKDPTFPRACRIQIELADYLKSLPADQKDIARELERLGARCETKKERLDCIYERKVESSSWLAGASEPEAIVGDFFEINFGVVKDGDTLSFEAHFERKERLKWRRGYPKDT